MLYQPRSPRQPSGSSSSLGADVACEKLARSAEGELRSDPLERTDALAVGENLSHALQPPAVHEHHAVHELDAALPARRENLPHVLGCDADRLFHEHVFSRFRRADHPRLANPCRQGDVHGIHGVAGQQFFVAAASERRRIKGSVSLTLADEPSAPVEISAGHGR